MSESKMNLNLTRRRFMTVSSAAIAVPFVMKMTGMVPHAEAAEKEGDKPYAGLKSVVIYYSQSGNTKKIGQAVQKGIISQTGQCDLVRIKEITPAELQKYDLIGFGAPTWGSCPSPIVIFFTKKLTSAFKDKHFFWFITHGMTPGRALLRGMQPLQEAGMTVIGWRDWYCGASLPGHTKPWYTDGHPDDIDLAEAESWGKALVVHSRKISDGQTELIPKLYSKEASDQIYGLGMPFPEGAMGGGLPEGGMPGQTTKKKPNPLEIPSSSDYVNQLEGLPTTGGGGASKMRWGGQDLKINPDKCIRCKSCVIGCPTYNIDDSVFPYAFKTQDCEFCLYCEGVCPTGAIEIIDSQPNAEMPGMETPEMEGTTKRTAGIFEVQLYFAEITGRFRRLVKEEDVGSKGSWEKVTGHPRHKEVP